MHSEERTIPVCTCTWTNQHLRVDRLRRIARETGDPNLRWAVLDALRGFPGHRKIDGIGAIGEPFRPAFARVGRIAVHEDRSLARILYQFCEMLSANA